MSDGLGHRCAHCGASCQGLRVRPDPDERDALARHAERLGIDRPFSRGFLRQNWGRCVFWDAGCRLHRELGAEAKPRVCRQFPFVFRGSAAALDPACFHADPASDGAQWADAVRPLAPGLRDAPSATGTSESLDLDGLWTDLSLGETIQAQLIALPLVAVLDGPHLGPLTTDLLRGLDTATPRAPTSAERSVLDGRIATVLDFALVPTARDGLVRELVGGSQLFLGAGRAPGTGFAAWVRLLRTGVL